METTDISYLSMAVGLLLMALPVYFFHRLGARLIQSTAIATVRMVVQLFLIGLYLRYLFEWNSPLVNFAWVLIMVLVATFTAARRTRLRLRTIALPLFSGLLATAVVVGLYFLVLVLRLDHPFDARYFVPIMGILMGNMLSVKRHCPQHLLRRAAARAPSLLLFAWQWRHPPRGHHAFCATGCRKIVCAMHCQYGSPWHSFSARNHDRTDTGGLGTGHCHQIPDDDNRHNVLSINAFANAYTAPCRQPIV